MEKNDELQSLISQLNEKDIEGVGDTPPAPRGGAGFTHWAIPNVHLSP